MSQERLKPPPSLLRVQYDATLIGSTFSSPRMLKYIRTIKKYGEYDDEVIKKALKLYHINVAYCEALYPSLHIFEISLRNAIDNAMQNHYGDKNWFIPSENFLNYYQVSYPSHCKGYKIIYPSASNYILLGLETQQAFSAIEKAINIYKVRVGKAQDIFKSEDNREQVLTNLTLGFWVSLLADTKKNENHYLYKVYIPCIKRIFPYAKKSELGHSSISMQLHTIKLLRNRIFHHEPIWSDENLMDKYHNIQKIISWIQPNILDWLKTLHHGDRFPEVHERCCAEIHEMKEDKKRKLNQLFKEVAHNNECTDEPDYSEYVAQYGKDIKD